MSKPDKNAPYLPPNWEDADAAAIDAVCKGTATPEQQRRAMDFIIYKLCGTYDLAYHPNERDTCFALGRQFVGLQIVALPKKLLIVKHARRVKNA